MTINANKLEMPKSIYFLGAGASVSGNAPTFSNFRSKANEVLHNWTNKKEVIQLFQRVLKDWNEHFDNYDIEKYYLAIEMNNILHHNQSINIKDIIDFIVLTIENPRKKLTTLEYKSLHKAHRNDGVAKAIFITTNWDILLERSILEIEIENKESALDTAVDKYAFINYDDMIQPYYKSVKPSINSFPPILKLHGSLNWVFCEKCGQIYYFNWQMYESLSFQKDIECPECYNVKLVPFIVPPTLSKLEKHAQLRSIWSKASEYLRLCEKLCFIGYSFAETDMQMKIFISNALRENSNLKEVMVVTKYDDPKKDEEPKKDFVMRYHSVLSKAISNPKICFYYNGFEEFCKKELDSWSKPLTF